MATTKAPTTTPAEPEVAKRRTITVAGVKLSVLAELAPDEWPSVERLASMHRSYAVPYGLAETKIPRAKAASIVNAYRDQLIDPKTKAPHTKAGVRPIVTAIAGEIRKSLRDEARARVRRERELARDMAKACRKVQAAKAKLEAKHPYVQLPRDAKPSKIASKDETRPILTGGLIRKLGRGPSARWVLQVTDSYRLVEFPLDMHGEGAADGSYIPREALRAIEQNEGVAFRVGKDGAVQPLALVDQHVGVEPYLDTYGGRHERRERTVRARITREVGVAIAPTSDLRVPRAAIRLFPAIDQLRAKAPAVTRQLRLTLNAQMLAELAAGLPGKGGVVTLVLDTGDFDEKTKAGVRLQTRKPIRVAMPNDSESIALLMPVKEGPNSR